MKHETYHNIVKKRFNELVSDMDTNRLRLELFIHETEKKSKRLLKTINFDKAFCAFNKLSDYPNISKTQKIKSLATLDLYAIKRCLQFYASEASRALETPIGEAFQPNNYSEIKGRSSIIVQCHESRLALP
jgi:hypothetical protein